MFYTYILKSLVDNNLYTGYTSDLKKRLTELNNGLNLSTSYRRPLILTYYEACIEEKDAINREIYLKSAWGKRYIKNRIKTYLRGNDAVK